MDDEDDIRARLRRAGAAISDEEWRVLPKPARERLRTHPSQTIEEKSRLAALVRWLIWEFPPGWIQAES